MKATLQVLGPTVLLLALMYGVAILQYGRIEHAFAVFNGERILPSPRVIDFGECEIGVPYRKEATLTNLTNFVAELEDVQFTCDCLALKTSKISIPPGESRAIDLEAVFTEPTEPSEVSKQFINMYVRGGEDVYVVRLYIHASSIAAPEPDLALEIADEL